MYRILTTDQKRPPSHLTIDGNVWPTQVLIDREQWDTLAEHGIYRHVTADGPAPLGYTDWALVDGQYVREPAGTQAERDTATNQQRWAQQHVIRERKRLQAVIDAPDDAYPMSERVNALKQLQQLGA
jgi:hypothetical protein